jgi:membrane protein implicated in regulation of membrane protease activity
MPWWLWILVGAVLLAAEMATPGGFFAVFFGIAAILVGLLSKLQLVRSAWVEWMLFSLLSIASLLLVRDWIVAHLGAGEGGDGIDETMIGEAAILTEDLDPGGVGRAELRGTTWTVRAAGSATLRRGDRCRVHRVDGLTLWVRPEPSGGEPT